MVIREELLSIERVRKAVDELLKTTLDAALYSCIECGACCDVCPVYNATRDPRNTPLFRVHVAKMLSEEHIDYEVASKYLFNCLLCGACSSACPFGIDIFRIVYLARCKLALRGSCPTEFTRMALGAIETLHSFGLSYEESRTWVKRGFRVDARNSEILYVPSPVETAFLPSHATETVEIMEKLGLNYTISTKALDCGGNVGVDASRPDAGLKILCNLINEAVKLGVEKIALGACGSDYKWIALARELMHCVGIEVPEVEFTSIYTILSRENLSINSRGEVALHDPCSMTRYINVEDDYNKLVRNPRKPRNKGVYTICCGGGGGMSLRRDREAREILLNISGSRIEQLSRESNTIVTPCIKCYIAFKMGILRHKAKVHVKGLSTYILERIRGVGGE